MRLVLTMPLLALSMVGPCFAQSDDFNPYQAVLDAMPLSQAQPLIEAALGPVEDTTGRLHKDFAGAGVKILSVRDASDNLSIFLFCDDRLAAVSAVVTTTVAAGVLAPLSLPSGPALVVNPSEQGVMISAEEPDVNFAYWGVGTETSYVSLSYPWTVFVNMDFEGRCQDVAAD
jgi:hypothetical protein